MGPQSKKEYMLAIRKRYQLASKHEKQIILNECCAICQFHRKYAIRLLNDRPKLTKSKPGKPGRKAVYSDPQILEIIMTVWQKTNLPCSKRLKVILQIWLPYYPFDIPSNIYSALMRISPATIDRLMKPLRHRYHKQGLGTTKPGSLLKKQIPIQTNQWDETKPGFLEVDTVAHCGTSVEGMFVYTVNCVDIATCWTEQRAIWGKGERFTLQAIEDIENSLPFPLLGFDCDNGSEFLNWHLFRHFRQRTDPIRFTRSRPYYKNDNAHIEEKNWTQIRQYLGYQRFDKNEIVFLLNDLYKNEWNLYFNFFIPSVKLTGKYRCGSQIVKKYDQPATPFQRLIKSDYVSPQTKSKMIDLYQSNNPFNLQEKMSNKIKMILKLINQ